MYSKDELLSKNIPELEDIAKQLGAEVKADANQEDIAYAILDKQAIDEGNKNPLGTKRRRTRIAKKDTDRVYSVNGKEGENFDLKKNKPATEQLALFKDEDKESSTAVQEKAMEGSSPEEIIAAIPKHRGRKSKKELAMIAAAEAALNKEKEQREKTSEQPEMEKVEDASQEEPNQDVAQEVAEQPTESEHFVPEEQFATEVSQEPTEDSKDLLAQLQARRKTRGHGRRHLGR